MRLFKKKVYTHHDYYARDKNGELIIFRKYNTPGWAPRVEQLPLKMVPPPSSGDVDELDW